MSLATRCTACGTVFRVVQDQLKVSEGWVRCGRCSEVFNALEALFDLERDAAPEAVPPIASAATAPEGPGLPTPTVELHDVQLTGVPVAHADPVPAPEPSPDAAPSPSAFDERIDAWLPRSRDARARSTSPADRVSERDRLEFPDAQFDPDVLSGEDPPIASPATGDHPPSEAPDADIEGPSPQPQAPHFVRRAQRRAHWQSPKMRGLQGAAIGALVLVLAVQAGHHFRDEYAARWPSMAPLLTAWCNAVGCVIEAPRRIDDLVVDSTALTRVPAADTFKLSVVLRNRGAVPVRLPFVDLSLTDASGQQVTRRMLSPTDFHAGAAPLVAGAEHPMQLLLLPARPDRVSGYTVEVFYP